MNSMSRRRVLLVTGAPRSGTTAVGRILAVADPGVSTLHEPFNYHVGLVSIRRYFEIPGTASFSEETLAEHVEGIRRLDLRYKPGTFPRERGIRRILKRLFGGRARNSYRACRLNPLNHTIVWKDPFAGFAADLLASSHDIDVLVTARNPWAVAASFQRMGWAFDLEDVLGRLAEVGADYRSWLGLLDAGTDRSAVNGAILWHAIYATLLDWSRIHSRIRFVNLEDIVQSPVATYAELYRILGLRWTNRTRSKIEKRYRSDTSRTKPQGRKAHDQNRDLEAINTYWRDLLAEDDRSLIAELDSDLWSAVRNVCIRPGASDDSGSQARGERGRQPTRSVQ